MRLPDDAAKAELLEIVHQLGLTGYTGETSRLVLYAALIDAGLDDETIAAEVEGHRGR